MNVILPIIIIIALGGLSSVVLHRLKWPLLLQSGVAALLATAVWGGGTCMFLWMTSPNEAGPSLLGPVIMTFLLTLLSVAAVEGLLRLATLREEREIPG